MNKKTRFLAVFSIIIFSAVLFILLPKISWGAGEVATYSFNEGSGTTATDSSGNANNGTLINGPTWTAGKYGNALSFDGVNDYIFVSDSNVLDLSLTFTISAWVNPDSFGGGGGGRIAEKRTGDSSGYNFMLYSAVPNGLRLETAAGAESVINSNSNVVTTGVWQHVAVVVSAGTATFYVNGANAGGGAIVSPAAGTGSLMVGNRADLLRGFDGLIDEVRLYSRALTQSEIQTDMNTPIGGTPLPPDIQAPTTPTNLSALAVSSSQINLLWTVSTDNVGVTGYRIYRGGTQIGTSVINSYLNTGLSANTTYYYTVSAYDAAGNVSSQSSSVNATTQAQSVTEPDPIKIYSTNPHYLAYKNKPILPIGDSVSQGWFEEGSNFNYRGYIDALALRGINTLMIWSYIGTNSSQQQSDARIGYDAPEIWPWIKNGSQFDLTQLNQTYFDNLKQLVSYAETKGVIVVISVHDGGVKWRWAIHPFNSSNGGPLSSASSYVDLNISANKNAQELFANKLITEFAPYGNVIYEIFNEGEWYDVSLRNSHEQYFLQFFNARTNKLLMTNTDHISGDNPHNDSKVDIISYHGGWTNRFGDFQSGFNQTPIKNYFLSEPVPEYNGSSPSLSDIRNSIWTTAIAGAGWVNQNDLSFGWDSNSLSASKSSLRDQAYDLAGYASKFFNTSGAKFWEMSPNSSLSSTGVAMANTGQEYVVYQPGSGSFTVNLSAGAGSTFNVKWFDPRTGQYTSTGTVSGGSTAAAFTPPSSGDWVLWLVKTVAGNPIDNVQPGQWYQVPNSRLDQSGVFPPSPTPQGTPAYIVDAWSGGIFDTLRNRLMIWGGGHGDYAGNEIYAFDIDTLKWTRAWGPTQAYAGGGAPQEIYPGGGPSSRHTYDGLVYMPTQDSMWSSGGSYWSGSGGGLHGTWIFNIGTSAWTQKANEPTTMGVAVLSAYDSVTGHVFFENTEAGGIYEYNSTNNTWTLRATGGIPVGYEMVGVIDPVNRLFVVVGNGYIHALNLQTGQLIQPTTTGGSAVINTRGPGLVYDPVIKKIVGWPGGNSSGVRDTYGDTALYSLDVTTWTWTKHTATPTNTVTPTGATRVGVFGRFQYIPSKNAYILVNATNENVYIYKLSSGGGTPPPSDTTPPTVSISTPTNSSTVSGSSVTISANANDNVGIVGVQFKLDGNNLGSEDTSSPYSITWNTTQITNGTHILTATARDAANNQTTSSGVTVTVSNASDTQAPTTPTNLSATTISSSQINLSWTASTDNVGVTGYRLERCQGSSCTTFSQISTPTVTSFNDTGLTANTTYRYRVRAVDGAGNLSGYSSIASATTQAGTSGQINIPLKTWVARNAPTSYLNGPCPGTNCKHMRWSHNPVDGLLYEYGGDWSGGPYYDSSRMEMWAYSVLNDTWIKKRDYCGPSGSFQPNGPDQVGWAWDSTRNKFWMIPGYQGDASAACPGVNMTRYKMATFNPNTAVWIDEQARNMSAGTGEDKSFVNYNSVTDKFYRFTGAITIQIYDSVTDSWYTKNFSTSNAQVGFEYSAMDVAGQVIYVISWVSNHLYRYNIASDTLTDLGVVPSSALPLKENSQYPVWDSVNNVLLWPRIKTFGDDGTADPQKITLYIYHPDTGAWETDTMYQPYGYTVSGNSAIFDPQQNVLMVMGQRTAVPNGKFFLYRYGNGNGAPDTTPPAVSVVTSSSITSSSAAITWTTNEASDSQVEYGLTTGYGNSTVLNASLVTSHSQTLSGLSASTLYNYRVKSKDAAGNLAVSPNYTFTTQALPDSAPPSRFNKIPSANLNYKTTGAVIGLNTDENSTCKYSTVSGAPYSSMTGSFISIGGKSHYAVIAGITSNTSYPYYVRCQDAYGNVNPDDFNITVTVANDTTAPERTNNFPRGNLSKQTTEVNLFLNTDENSTCKYSTVSGTAYSSMANTFTNTGGLTHSTPITGLTLGTYNYYVKCFDARGNANTNDFSIFFSVSSSVASLESNQILASSESPSQLTSSLSYGTQSEEVALLQEILAKINEIYPEKMITGFFGNLTRKAVQNFQCSYGIVCEGDSDTTGHGRVGPRTRVKINEMMAGVGGGM